MRIIPIIDMNEELVDLIKKRAWYSVAYKNEKDYINMVDSSRVVLFRKENGEIGGYSYIDFRDMDDSMYFVCYCELREYDPEQEIDIDAKTNRWGDYAYAPVPLIQKDMDRIEEELNNFYLREDPELWTVPAYMRNKDIVDYKVEKNGDQYIFTSTQPMESEFMNMLEISGYLEFVEFNDGKPVFKTNPELFLMEE